MNKVQLNKDFDNLVKYNLSKGVIKCEDNDYKNLIEWANKNDPTIFQNVKKTDYGFYIITFIIIFFVIVILLILYYTEKLVTDNLDSLIDENNKSSYIDIDEYDAEELIE